MYSFNAVIDQSQSLAKQFLYAVPHTQLREEMTKVVNAQVDFTKAVCGSVEQVSKIVTEEFRKLATTSAFTK
jgi:hypothetical protein